jgi:hypothetical protein
MDIERRRHMLKAIIFLATFVVSSYAHAEVIGDVDGDGQVGLPEAIYSLQSLAGIRSPLANGDAVKTLKNILTVAKGNGNFTDPVAAVNSITDASESNPYLVVIGPGIYTISQTLVMKQYVNIVGCGENITKLTGAISTNTPASSAIISGASNSALSSLTVENTGGSYYSIALYIDSASSVVREVSTWASSGVTTVAIWNLSSTPTITNVTASASGGISYGVYNQSSSFPIIRQSVMEGQTNGLYTEADSRVKVGLSTIKNGAGGWNNKCTVCDDENGSALDQFCRWIPQ